MSDPHAKHWLADDPNFLASLGDLDRGLAEGDAEDALPEPPPALNHPGTPNRAAAASPPPPLRRPPDIADDIDERALPSLSALPPSETRVRRPLLDLFPASALVDERPPNPTLGAAVGPQLPPSRARAMPRTMASPEPSAGPPGESQPPQLDGLSYETFYGLREKPFSLSTDPRFLYQSAAHERAAQALHAAISARSGAAVLTAPLGAGKTTLCRWLVAGLDRRTVTSLVLEPPQSLDDLLAMVLVDFGVMSRDDLSSPRISRTVLTSTLTSFLASLVALQASALVILDEAQHLPPGVLGELGTLLDAAGPAARVLQLVLVGQPALLALLQDASVQPIEAGVARRIELGPLAGDEISGYVTHRLSTAGAHTRIEFDEAAIARLYALSAGAPRMVNLLCDRAMTRGQQASAAVIDETLIETAAADLDLDAPPADAPGLLTRLLLIAGFLLLMLAGAAGAIWVSRDAVNRTILQWEQRPVAPGGPVPHLPPPLSPK